jgi:hypothetical protein
MKNPVTQNIFSVLLGLLFSLVCIKLFNIDTIVSLVFGAISYFASMLLLSRTPKQKEEDFKKLDVKDNISTVNEKIKDIQRFSELLRQKPMNQTQSNQILNIAQFAQSIINGLHEHGMDLSKLRELRSYLEDFSQAIQGYIEILHNTITISDPTKRQEAIQFFEDLLPTFEIGFQKLAENVDQSEALLATMKAQLLKNKMLSHGRIDF